MDPASIGLAVGSILGLTKATARLASAMWTVFRDQEGNILSEIAESVNSLETNSGVIETAVQALERHAKTYPESMVVRKLEDEGHIKGIDKQAKVLKRKMRAVEKRIQAVHWVPEIQWVLYIKAKVDALIPVTTSVQCVLQLAITTISQDVMRSLPTSQDSQIAEFMQEMLKQKQEEAENKSSELKRLRDYCLTYSGQGSLNRSHLHKLEKIAEDILTLANEFDKAHSVPQRTPSEASQQPRADRTSSGAVHGPDSSRSASVSPQPVSLPPTPSSSSSYFNSDSSASRRPLSLLGPSPDTQTQSGSLALSPNIVPINLAGPTSSPKSSEALSSSSKDHEAIEDYYAVRPTPRKLNLDRNKDRKAVFGFISSDDSMRGRIPIIARRDETLAENLISLSAARRFDLVIEEEDGLERVIFENNSSTVILGKVAKAFAWMQGKGPPIRMKASFWVCEHLREDVILGAPFHDREAHLRKERNRS